jgi:D-glycero-alpha-D-manno-heptose-7-phosphate kinase
MSKQQLAEEACLIEQSVIGERVGSQDQFHAAFGGVNVFEFGQDRIAARPVIMPPENRRALENHLFVFYTGLTRFAHEVVEEQLSNTDALSCDASLDRMYEMVFEAEEILSKAPADELPLLLGRLLHENWLLKKKLSRQISNPQIDRWIEKAISCGAAGGKICGAGGGGFLAFLVPTKSIASVREGLKELQEVSLHLESHGSTILYMKA